MNSISRFAAAALAAAAVLGAAPDGAAAHSHHVRHVYFLYDASKSYVDDYDANYRTINNTLGEMSLHDGYSFAMIGDCGFSGTPAYEPKRNVAMEYRYFNERYDWIDRNSSDVSHAISALTRRNKTDFTDIEGALTQAAWQLRDSGDGERFLVIFSDMDNDPAPVCGGARAARTAGCGGPAGDLPPLGGIHVAIVNMTQNKADERDRHRYQCRRTLWEEQLHRANALSVRFFFGEAHLFPAAAAE
jgi:hypothetical protein